ncbi:MAG: transposase [Cellulosilyticum sp.]|nr:transposase [Cellulosilyticum sp.]
MKYNRKIEIVFEKEDELILDGQSKICNWLYNKLLDICKSDYALYGRASKITFGNNIRDMVPALKYDFPFLSSVHSSPTKNVGRRLQDAYKDFYSKKCEYPKFRSWKYRKWFSLYYDEPNKGFSLVTNKIIQISLGKNMDNKQMYVHGEFKEAFNLNENEKIKTFRLCKEKNKFFGVFTIEAPDTTPKAVERWIAIDQNHKNFFVAIDHNGQTFEFTKLYQDKYFDNIIDELKSNRDKCNRKHKKKVTHMSNATYYVPNRRWVKLDKAIKRNESRKREQTKQIMYSIAHFIAQNYDKVIIGDYVPSKSKEDICNINRDVINQSHVGEFRSILGWVMTKSHKSFVKVSEQYTTQTCCVCGKKEKKDVTIREFTCKKCNTFILRDVNSAINIAKKDNLVPLTPSLSKINRVGTYVFKQRRLVVI